MVGGTWDATRVPRASIITNCTFIRNRAANGGAIYAKTDRSLPLYMENCLVYSNTATSYAIHGGDGTVQDVYRVDMVHCTVADNTGAAVTR